MTMTVENGTIFQVKMNHTNSNQMIKSSVRLNSPKQYHLRTVKYVFTNNFLTFYPFLNLFSNFCSSSVLSFLFTETIFICDFFKTSDPLKTIGRTAGNKVEKHSNDFIRLHISSILALTFSRNAYHITSSQ